MDWFEKHFISTLAVLTVIGMVIILLNSVFGPRQKTGSERCTDMCKGAVLKYAAMTNDCECRP